MSQRNSGYERIANDAYYTPKWPIECLRPHIPYYIHEIFEPACGHGAIVETLNSPQFKVTGADLNSGYNFLDDNNYHEAIITNPPYDQAERFIAKAIANSSFTAMLLRTDYGHAKTRKYLFADNPFYAMKIELIGRIVWRGMEINPRTGKKAQPSFNHSWFIWNKKYAGPTILVSAP